MNLGCNQLLLKFQLVLLQLLKNKHLVSTPKLLLLK